MYIFWSDNANHSHYLSWIVTFRLYPCAIMANDDDKENLAASALRKGTDSHESDTNNDMIHLTSKCATDENDDPDVSHNDTSSCYDDENVVLTNVFELLCSIDQKMDQKNIEIYKQLLFLLETDRVENAKNILRYKVVEDVNVKNLSKNIVVRNKIEAIQERLIRVHENVKTLVIGMKEYMERVEKIKNSQEIVERIKEMFSDGIVGDIDVINLLANIKNDYMQIKDNVRQDLDERMRNLVESNEILKEKVKMAKRDNIKIKNDLIIISNDHYKLKEQLKKKTGIIKKQKHIIDILQNKLSLDVGDGSASIINDLKFRIELLKNKLEIEGDEDRRRALSENLNDFKKRLRDFMDIEN